MSNNSGPDLAGGVRRLRAAAGLTQQGLAEKIATTRGFVAHPESGRREGFATDGLYKSCDALGVACARVRPFLADAGAAPPAGPGAGKQAREPAGKGGGGRRVDPRRRNPAAGGRAAAPVELAELLHLRRDDGPPGLAMTGLPGTRVV